MGNEYLRFIESLEKVYLEGGGKGIEGILASIDENTSWIGTGKQEICESFSEATQDLIMAKREYNGGFTVTDRNYKSQMIAHDACIVYGEFCAIANEKSAGIANLHHRISAICVKTMNEIKLLHIHMSIADNDQEYGEYYVKDKIKVDKETLRIQVEQATKELQRQSQELEILTANIPGGVHQCKNDQDFTLVNMSSGFLSMFGYAREDIANIFDDKFMNMIYKEDRKVVSTTVLEQSSHGKTIEIEYRVKCSDGSLMWVLDRGKLATTANGEEYSFCVLLDINERKKEDEKLRLALERHKLIMDQATDIIFEWDIKVDIIDFSSNWEKRFGYAPISRDISKKIPNSDNIHIEDMHDFVKIMRDTAAGMPYSEAEFRIKNISGEYTWCRIRATTQFDDENQPIKAVGVIVDIENEKSKSSALLEAAQRDALTQLYNKNITRTKIEAIINNKKNGVLHALMMIDVDDFKNINDRFGHQCGDAVLANMGKSLKKLFRATDVKGRVGGDEFMVFIENANSEELIAEKAKEIVQIFSEMPIELGGNISCSVGISIYPKDGRNYEKLVRAADKTLYGVKNSGKSGIAFYDQSLDNDMPYSTLLTAINSEIDVEKRNMVNKDLAQHIFQLLYDTTDIKKCINHILEVIGRIYGVSRVYIFENSTDGKYCNNTFEWCNEGIAPEIDKLQNLSFEEKIAGFFDIYDENGVFYCQDIQKLNPQLRDVLIAQNAVSVIHCLSREGGMIKGYMGFDECKNKRYWTKEEIDMLSLISNILSTFLVKQRLNEQIARLKKN